MDFNKLTIKSGEAVAAAQELARRAGNPELTRDHLTVALLEQELPRTLLQRAGADPSSVLAEAEARLRALPAVSGRERRSHRRAGRSARRSTTRSTRRASSTTSSSRSSTSSSRSSSCPARRCSAR